MSSSFAHTELEQALSEIPWGYKHSSIHHPPSKSNDDKNATAELQLLCGRSIEIQVSQDGWKVIKDPQEGGQISSESAAHEDWSETLDDLLAKISPEFKEKRMEKLFEKLNQHAREIRHDDGEEGGGEEEDDERGEYKES